MSYTALRQRITGRSHFGTSRYAPAVEVRYEDSQNNRWSAQTAFEMSPRDSKQEDFAKYLFIQVLQMIPHNTSSYQSYLRRFADPFYESNDLTDLGEEYGLTALEEMLA